jgi:hypothetical protein
MKPEDYERIIRELRAETRCLEKKNKELIMKLAAIKLITNHVYPVCPEKLQNIISECTNCKINQ